MKQVQMKNVEDEKKDIEKRKFIDGLDQYFRYKDKYENLIKKEKTQIIKMVGLSWREKRVEFMKIKPKCVNCKRPVGSIFSTKVEDDGRHLIGLCGDRQNPCPFNININLGIVENIEDNLYNDENNLNDYKKDVIIDKNDLLFGYITPEEAVDKFDKIKEKVTEFTKVYEFTLQTYLKIVDNEEKKAELKNLQIDFYNNLDNFNSMVNQFKNTQNTQLIVEAIDLYVNTMHPRANEIMNRKYNYTGVEYNEDNNTFHLVQLPTTYENLEWDLTETGQKIVSFKIGMENMSIKQKPVKNVAFSAAIPDIKSKVQEQDLESISQPGKFKLKPQLRIQEENDEESSESDNESDTESDNESDDSEELKPLPKIKIYPNLLPDGSISASEAHRLNLKIEIIKGELIAKNDKTGETYKVTAGK
jgi:hypothetical protein